MPFAIILDEKDQEVSREELDRKTKPQGGFHKRLDGNFYKYAGDPRSMDAISKQREEKRKAKEDEDKAKDAQKKLRPEGPVQQHQSSFFRPTEENRHQLGIYKPLSDNNITIDKKNPKIVGYTNTKIINAIIPMTMDRALFRCFNYTKEIDKDTGTTELFGAGILDGMGVPEICKHDWFAKIQLNPKTGTISFWLFSPAKDKPDIIVIDGLKRSQE
jgi:hypothetical protein